MPRTLARAAAASWVLVGSPGAWAVAQHIVWQRLNYFLVLNSALAVGFFTLDRSSVVGYPIALAVAGLFAALLWIRINAGSKFWQSRWEARLGILEGRVLIDAPTELFATSPETIRQDAASGLGLGNNHGLRKAWDQYVMTKPSVSSTMVLLSSGFVLLWLSLLGLAIYKLVRG